jgi:hypothetical protein
MQPFYCVLSVLAPNGVIPFRNQVPQWTALMAKWDSAIHASSGLRPYNPRLTTFINFLPVHDSNVNRSAFGYLAISDL